MENIIHEFLKKVTKFNEKEKINLSLLTSNLKETGEKFILDILRYILEKIDEEIRESKARKKEWYIERYDKRKIKTVLGELVFTRTYYVKKRKKREYAYLLDQALGINKYSRMEEGVEAKLLEYANELSYKKAGELFDEKIKLSKETVRNKVKKFRESKIGEEKELTEKKVVKYLYIDADEDHVSLQTGKSKINKLIYVYEGKIRESKNRKYLLNKRVFGSVEKSPEDLWIE